ncbi:MAG: tyrosine-type recombinase/integrase [Candidatus Spechtbacterales bacterium]
MTKKDKQEILPYFDDFLLHIQTNNYSKETLYNYERDLRTLGAFLTSEMNGLPFSDIQKRTIEQFKAYLTSNDRKTSAGAKPQKQLQSGSINRILSSVRRYLVYLIDMDYKVPIAPESIKLLRTEKKHPQVAELEDLTRLIETPNEYEKDKLVGLRNRAMLELLFATGMRISELVNLKRDQVDKTGKIFITGKGKKQRFVYLTDRAIRHLKTYLDERSDNSDFMFVPYRGRNAQEKRPISTNYLQMKIKQYRNLVGINVPTSAHSLRHGFATYLAEKGANPAAIQILLGHESLDTTTRYVHASDKYAQRTHKRFHPLKD